MVLQFLRKYHENSHFAIVIISEIAQKTAKEKKSSQTSTMLFS